MKRVVLIFPDTRSMADFILKLKVNNSEANTFERTLIATLTDAQIKIAETEYKAFLKVMIPAF